MSQWTVPSDTALRFTFGPWQVCVEAFADPSGLGVGDELVVAWNDPGEGWDVVFSITYQPADVAAAGGMGNWLLNPLNGGPSPFQQVNAALKQFFSTKPQLPQLTNQSAYSAPSMTEMLDEYFVGQVSIDGTYPQLVQVPFNPNPPVPGSPAQPAPPTIISSTSPVFVPNGVQLTVNGTVTVYPLADWNGATNPPTLTVDGVAYQVIVQQ